MYEKWKGELIHFFRRGCFKDFPGPYFAICLCWKLCFGHKHVDMQKRQTTRAWNHVQTRHTLCISDLINMRESNERTMGIKKNKCFHTFWKHFENFIFCIPKHLFSFTLKLISVDIFRFCLKQSRTFKNQNQFQVLSRPLNWTPEIRGFSRRILTQKWKY